MSTANSTALNLTKKYPIFKKLYLFYNIYIRNLKFYIKSSQFEEEKKVLDYFDKKYKGNFVDLGCFHPTRYNNTFKMYKLGWRGINIDLNKLSIDFFNFARPGDINICAAVSNKNAKKNLFYVGDLAPQNTIQKEHLRFLKKDHKIGKKDIKIKKVKTQKLNDILERNHFYKIDFMNIDIEGHELDVLNSLNLKKYKTNIICIEIFEHNKFYKTKKRKLLNFFKKNGYKLLGKTAINYIFKKMEKKVVV